MYKYNIKYCKNTAGLDKRLLVFYWQLFWKKKFGYQFTNKKAGKVTKFGLITNSTSKIMQKKPGSWYKNFTSVNKIDLVDNNNIGVSDLETPTKM